MSVNTCSSHLLSLLPRYAPALQPLVNTFPAFPLPRHEVHHPAVRSQALAMDSLLAVECETCLKTPEILARTGFFRLKLIKLISISFRHASGFVCSLDNLRDSWTRYHLQTSPWGIRKLAPAHTSKEVQ